MKFEVDLNKLLKNKISITEYLLLQIIKEQDYSILDNYRVTIGNFFNKSSVDYLIEKGFVKIVNKEVEYYLNNLELTKLYEKEFEEKIVPNLENWIDEWYEIFPKGIKTGGYLVRSDKKGCIAKLKKFKKEYPELYDKDLIIAATKEYVSECRLRNFDRMQLAHYFIFKDGISNLASFCQNILEKGTTSETDSFSKSLN